MIQKTNYWYFNLKLLAISFWGKSPPRFNRLRRFTLPPLLGRERPATQAKTVQWTVFSESPSSYAAKAEAP